MSVTLDIWSLIAFGIGFWMLADGLFVGAMPALVQRLLAQMQDMPADEMQRAGLMCAALGAVIIYFIVSF